MRLCFSFLSMLLIIIISPLPPPQFSHPVGNVHHLHTRLEGGVGSSINSLNTLTTSNSGVKRVSSSQATTNNISSTHEKRSGSSGSVTLNDSGGVIGRNNNSENQNVARMGRHIGPHEILAYNGSAEAVRERNAFSSLLDFFGM